MPLGTFKVSAEQFPGHEVEIRPARDSDYASICDLYPPKGDYLACNYHFYLTYRTNYCMVLTVDGQVVSFGFASMLDNNQTVMTRGGRTSERWRSRGLISMLMERVLEHLSCQHPGYSRLRYITNTRVIGLRPDHTDTSPGTTTLATRAKLEFNFSNDDVRRCLAHIRVDCEPVTKNPVLLRSWSESRRLLMNVDTARECFLALNTVLISRIPYECGVVDNLAIIRDNENPTVFSDQDGSGRAGSVSFGTVYGQVDGESVRLDVDLYCPDQGSALHHLLLQLHHHLSSQTQPQTHFTLLMSPRMDKRQVHDLCRHTLNMTYTDPGNDWTAMENYNIVFFQRPREAGGAKL